MKDIYTRTLELISEFENSYELLSSDKKEIYDDLVYLESSSLSCSDFDTEEEKQLHMQSCIEEFLKS